MALVLLGCGVGGIGGNSDGSTGPVGSQHLSGEAPGNQNTPDFPGGVPAPDSNWEPCMDKEHCDQEKKSDNEAQDDDAAKPEDTGNTQAPPTGDMWEDIKNNHPDRPPGKLKIPGKS